jgi:hypothetical protein
VLPTRLGNALRAGETYGWVQYGLSTVDMWTRLTAVAEDKINNQLVESRAVLNFYIALIWLSLALCFATVVVTVWAGKVLLLLWAGTVTRAYSPLVSPFRSHGIVVLAGNAGTR